MARRTALATLMAAVVIGAAAPARAQFSLGDQRAGTASGTFLKIAIGARATGLGESFVAVANDPSAIFWNPAGLASVLRQEVYQQVQSSNTSAAAPRIRPQLSTIAAALRERADHKQVSQA